VVVTQEDRGEKTVYLKGAPLETLEVCDRILSRGEVKPLDQTSRKEISAANDAMASRGLRVLGLAYREDSDLKERSTYGIADVERQLVFLGLVAISDPVRPEVSDAIKACHAAGIRVIMITGDYALTAASIGREIGLGDGRPPKYFSGTEVSEMNDERLRAILKEEEIIFARVAPEHKLRIVALLKEMGERGGGSDWRRSQRRPGIEESRHRDRHGREGPRRREGGGAHDPRGRQLQLHRRGH
jgi:magnesium-transporting ATPase (P-type)